MVAPGRMVTSSRRIGRVTNKTKLIIYRGSDKVDTSAAETVLWDQEAGGAGKDSTKHQHIGATGVESGELLVRIRMCSFTFHYAWEGVALGGSRENGPLIAGVFFFLRWMKGGPRGVERGVVAGCFPPSMLFALSSSCERSRIGDGSTRCMHRGRSIGPSSLHTPHRTRAVVV